MLIQGHKMIQPSIRYLSSLVFLLLFARGLVAQPDSAAMRAPHLDWKTERNPALLVEALTAGMDEDTAKFEAIFAWVASNIHYDYRSYFSGKGYDSETDVKRVLIRRKAICFQYAALMNELCAIAGIHSVTVTGYAKDMLFDINDTLYFDNHAWNAVKLNDRWYLYDVTWSAGGYEYRLTHFSQRVYQWRLNIQAKRKKLRKHVTVIHYDNNPFCEIPKHKEKKVRMVLELPLFWRVVDWILSLPRMRMVIDHGKVKNKDYYLTEPRLFAITHFPNAPYWSLTPEISNTREFSADKSYYDLDKKQYLIQEREGKECRECDDFFALDSLGQYKEKIRASLDNNPRNGLEPAANYFHIANLFYKDADEAIDSLDKVQGYDSTVFYLDLAKRELKRSHPQNKAYFKFHTGKDNEKVKLLKNANKKHTAVNVVNVSNLRKRANKIKLIGGKIRSNQRTYYRNHHAMQRFRPKNPAAKTMKDETAENLEGRLDVSEQKLDSLNDRIEELETDFMDRLNNLGDRVWEQEKLLYPQLDYFYECGYERMYGMLDDRDKRMIEYQDSIRKYEAALLLSVKDHVLLPTDTLYVHFIELTKLIKRRDAAQFKTLKLYAQLYAGNIISRDSLEAVRTRFLDLTKKDYCYFFKHRLPIADFTAGYELFRDHHYELYRAIKRDNKAEMLRHKAFVKEISLTKKRANHVINNNLKYQAKYKRQVQKEKREYIRERKKANKKAMEEGW